MERGEPEATKITEALQEQLNDVRSENECEISVIYQRKTNERRIDCLEKVLLIGLAVIIVALFKLVRRMDDQTQLQLLKQYRQQLGRAVVKYVDI